MVSTAGGVAGVVVPGLAGWLDGPDRPSRLPTTHRGTLAILGSGLLGLAVGALHLYGAKGLLAELRRRGVTIEISLTSSDLILGVRGKDHPLSAYLAAGVPVVLATDDAGVARIDLTHEYMRAAREHKLGYRTLKAIARNSHALQAVASSP